MRRLMLFLRKHFHPIFRLRRFSAFQWATRCMDLPIAIRFQEISHPVYVSLSKNLSWVLSGGASCEEGERENFIWLVKAGAFRSFLDVGANIGLYGFIFASIVNDATVTMIEPDDSNARLIRKTIHASKVRLTLVEAAASDESRSMTFYKDGLTGSTGSLVRSGDDSYIATYHHQAPLAMSIRAVTLDELCPVDSPDFIKIDVEGAELKVLRGAQALISRFHPALMFECDQDQEAVCFFLHRHAYSFFDMESLLPVDAIPHNCLALHPVEHAAIIAAIAVRTSVIDSTLQ
jgi:FkbM family methyltransferase